MPCYKRMVQREVANKYRRWVLVGQPNGEGFVSCSGWHHHLCPMDKMIRYGRVRCKRCWYKLRDAKKEKRAARKAVADVWDKFETPAKRYKCDEIDSTEDEDGPEFIVPDDQPKAEASDPLAAHKLATILGARGECGFQSLGTDEGQRLDKMNEPSILYETMLRLAYIADTNVITPEERKAASRCGGLPVRPPYLLPRLGMPHVADTEDSVYHAFLVRLGNMTLQEEVVPVEEKLRAMHFFGLPKREKVECCQAALAAACVAHNQAKDIDVRSVTPEWFEGGVYGPGNLSTSQ